MSEKSVTTFLETLARANPTLSPLVQELRDVIRSTVTHATEDVKYGGLVYAGDTQFCGVFAYKDHVSIEFSRGAALSDPHGVLEGTGTHRRHIKLFTPDDIATKAIASYVRMASA